MLYFLLILETIIQIYIYYLYSTNLFIMHPFNHFYQSYQQKYCFIHFLFKTQIINIHVNQNISFVHQKTTLFNPADLLWGIFEPAKDVLINNGSTFLNIRIIWNWIILIDYQYYYNLITIDNFFSLSFFLVNTSNSSFFCCLSDYFASSSWIIH